MAEARLLDKDSVYTYLVAKNLPQIVESAGKHLSDAVTGAFIGSNRWNANHSGEF